MLGKFQFRGVLQNWIMVVQWPAVFAVAADRGCLDSFSLVYHPSCLSTSLWETA